MFPMGLYVWRLGSPWWYCFGGLLNFCDLWPKSEVKLSWGHILLSSTWALYFLVHQDWKSPSVSVTPSPPPSGQSNFSHPINSAMVDWIPSNCKTKNSNGDWCILFFVLHCGYGWFQTLMTSKNHFIFIWSTTFPHVLANIFFCGVFLSTPQGGDFFLFGSFVPPVKAHSTVCDELLTLHSSISLFYTCSAFTTGWALFYHLCWITVPILGLQNRCQYHFRFMKQNRDRERRSVTKLGLEPRYLSLKLCS